MDCPLTEEIVIVWNNQQSPQDAGFQQLAEWKRPVHLHRTPHNSMDLRYSLPPESRARVFFSADDGIIITCAELQKDFQEWKKNVIGDVGPLVGYGQKSFDFSSEKAVFLAQLSSDSRFYQFTLIGEAWVSRHYLELYNANQTWEVQEVRKVVSRANNCDDIAMNFLVKYFYPEFPVFQRRGPVKIRLHIKERQYKKRNF